MPTMKDVAERSSVSTATVSAVINNATWVSEATRARVLRVIEETGYRPNRLARSLKTQQSYAIGVIVSDLTNPFFTEVVRSLSHALRQHDRTLFLCDSDHRFDLGDENFRMLIEKQVDGLVIIGGSVQEKTLAGYLRYARAAPVVVIERDYGLAGMNCLLVDSEQGGYDATMHLAGQGFHRIGMISGPAEGPGSATYGRLQRYEGYLRALGEAGLEADPQLVAQGNFRYEGGQRAMERLLALPTPPEAVFAANDLMALGAMNAARAAGLRVPDDLALVGYDDISPAALTTPSLTTMAMPKRALGEAAAELLHQQIESQNGQEPVRCMFAANLVVRESSRRYRP